MRRTLTIISILLILGANCKKINNPPHTPRVPTGPLTGRIDSLYIFKTMTTDPNNDSLSYRFDWGDGDTSDWSPWVASGDSVSMSHSWTQIGTYYVKAQAKDINGLTSDWSDGRRIAIWGGWTKTFGGPEWDGSYSIQKTADGGYIITGSTYSFGAGESDVYLIKTDARGNLQWQKTFGGQQGDEGYSVQQTSDGGYIITGLTYSFGAGRSDVYLIKTDAQGNLQWQKTFGGSDDDYGYSVQKTTDGGYIVTGLTYSFGVGESDVYLIKTDAQGNLQWQKTFGSFFEDGGHSVQQTSDGGYIIAGYTELFGPEERDVYLIKTDALGNEQWIGIFGDSLFNDIGYSIKQTSDSGYIIAGYTRSYGAGRNDIYLIKTDAQGILQWQKTFGGSDEDYGYSVEKTSDGGYIIAGATYSFGAGGSDVYLIKTDATGNPQWEKTFGGSLYDYGFSLHQTADGGYIITGITYSFGAGEADVYLIKTDASGNSLNSFPISYPNSKKIIKKP